MAFLGTLGFDVIPVDFVSVYRFGGSFHCCTVDVRRDGLKVRHRLGYFAPGGSR